MSKVWDFLKVRKKYWITPIVIFLIILILVGLLDIFVKGNEFSLPIVIII